jgi:cytochrome c oxidase subunit III
MSSISTTPPTSHDAHGHGHDDGNGHDPHLAHHFDTPEQQIASGKLGMWVFLATEILMFGGLFCAYAVYRHNHPEVFEAAHKQLDKTWGAINTIVLITSSLTMAWGVRLAQLGRNKGLIITLILTLLGGFGFMMIKSVEYKTKWEHGLGVGQKNVFRPDPSGAKGITDDELIPGAGRPSTGEHEAHGAAGDAHAAPAPATTGATSKPAAKHDEHGGAGASAGGTGTAKAGQEHSGAGAVKGGGTGAVTSGSGDAHQTHDPARVTADTQTHGKTDAAHPGAGVPAAAKPAINPEYFDPNKGTGDEAKVVPTSSARLGWRRRSRRRRTTRTTRTNWWSSTRA